MALYEGVNVGYRFLLFLHILLAIVGFGSTFVWPALAGQARKLDDPGQRFAITHAAYKLGKPLSTYPIIAVGVVGVLMIPLSDQNVEFKDTWVGMAFLLFFIALGVSLFLHAPNLTAMDELGAKLVAGQFTPVPGGPPAEVTELQERAKKAQMFGGILHLLFVLILLVMVFKPGMGLS